MPSDCPPHASPEGLVVRRHQPVAESLNASGIWAFESRHDESFLMQPERHRFVKLLLIREGVGWIEGDWGRPNCNSGDIVMVPAGLRHRVVDAPGQPIALYGLGVAGSLLRSVAGVERELPRGVISATKLRHLRVEHRLRRILFLDRQPLRATRLACVAEVLDLLAQLVLAEIDPKDSPCDDRDPLIEGYLAWVQQNFYEPMSIETAAASCGMSRRHFTAAFKRHTGTTWLAYLNRLRVAHATTLLQGTNHKISSIAFQCGFDDLSTFYRVVGRVTGKRPGDLRG